MGFRDEFKEGRDWVAEHLSFDKVGHSSPQAYAPTFERTLFILHSFRDSSLVVYLDTSFQKFQFSLTHPHTHLTSYTKHEVVSL